MQIGTGFKKQPSFETKSTPSGKETKEAKSIENPSALLRALCEAAADKVGLAAVRDLIENKKVAPNGEVLNAAAKSGSNETLQYLINYLTEVVGINLDSTPQQENFLGWLRFNTPDVIADATDPKRRLHEKFKDGTTVLHIAAINGDVKVLADLLDSESKHLNQAELQGLTPLLCAVRTGNKPAVELLLARGAHLEAPKIGRFKNYTPLDTAVAAGHVELIKYFIEKQQADVTAPEIGRLKNRFLLNIAVANGHLPAVQYLVEQQNNDGCQPFSHGSDKGYTPLQIALAKGQLAVAKYIIENHKENQHAELARPYPEGEYLGFEALHLAAAKGQLEIVKCLIEQKKSDVNSLVKAKPHLNEDSLQIALMNGHFAVAKYLIEHGADINRIVPAGPFQGYSAFHIAAAKGDLEAVRYFVEIVGINFDVRIATGGSSGAAAIHCAACNGHLEVVKYLVEKCKIDCNKSLMTAGPNQGLNVLHLAAALGQFNVIKCLIEEKKADVNTLAGKGSRENQDALSLAAHHGRLEIVKYLIINGAHIQPPVRESVIHAAIERNRIEIVTYLLNNYKFDLEIPFFRKLAGITLLQRAAAKNFTEIAKLLIAHGADLNNEIKVACEHTGYTPLVYAIENNNLELAEYLIALGVNCMTPLTSGKYRGWSPMHLAVQLNRPEILACFVRAGAKIDTPLPPEAGESAGFTPISIAALDANAQMVKNIIAMGGNCHEIIVHDSYSPMPLLHCILLTAVKNPEKNFEDTIRVLVAAKADRDFEMGEFKQTAFVLVKDRPRLVACLKTELEERLDIFVFDCERLLKKILAGVLQLPKEFKLTAEEQIAGKAAITKEINPASYLKELLNNIALHGEEVLCKEYKDNLQLLLRFAEPKAPVVRAEEFDFNQQYTLGFVLQTAPESKPVSQEQKPSVAKPSSILSLDDDEDVVMTPVLARSTSIPLEAKKVPLPNISRPMHFGEIQEFEHLLQNLSLIKQIMFADNQQAKQRDPLVKLQIMPRTPAELTVSPEAAAEGKSSAAAGDSRKRKREEGEPEADAEGNLMPDRNVRQRLAPTTPPGAEKRAKAAGIVANLAASSPVFGAGGSSSSSQSSGAAVKAQLQPGSNTQTPQLRQ